jgi:hypothetical protein
MDRNKYESNLKIYKKLIDYAKSVLKDCGYDENSHYTYNNRQPTIDEYTLFIHEAKLLIANTLGTDSTFYNSLARNIATMQTTALFGHILKKNVIPAYDTFKKMHIFEMEFEKQNAIQIRKIDSGELFKNIRWENMTIKFLDGYNVSIYSAEFKIKVNYKDMGFEDSRILKPNYQWEYYSR